MAEQFVNGSNESRIVNTIKVNSGQSITMQDLVIYYDSSTSPVFNVLGTLRLINCKVIPLRDSVDFIHAYDGSLYLENVTMINPVFNNSNKIIDADRAKVTMINSTFKGFARSEIRWKDDVYISGCQINVTEKFYLQNTDNLSILNSKFDLLTENSTNLFEVQCSNDCYIYNCTFTLPISTAVRLRAWLVGVEFRYTNNIEYF